MEDKMPAKNTMPATTCEIHQENGLQYAFGWSTQEVNKGDNLTIEFRHGLGRAPFLIQVIFSPDRNLDDVTYLRGWSAPQYEHEANPASIWADTGSVYMSISPGAQTHRRWTPNNPNNGGWQEFNSGYFGLIAI